MEAQTLKVLCESGGVIGARVEAFPIKDMHWTLRLIFKNGTERPFTKARSNDPKVYKSINAAMSDVSKIGLKSAEVCLK